MRSLLYVLMFLACLGGVGPLRAAEPPPDPRALLARAKEASGGAAWDGKRTLYTRAEVEAGGLTGAAEVWEDLVAGRMTSTFELGPVEGTAGFDGAASWSRDGSGQVHVTDDRESAEEAANEAYLRCLGHFFPERWPAKVVYARREREGERSFEVLSVTPERGRALELWLDAESLLLDRTVDHGPTRTSTRRFSDYRPVAGVRLPFVQRSSTGQARYDQVARAVAVELDRQTAADAYRVPESKVTDFSFEDEKVATTVPFELINNHIYARIMLEGKGPFRMLVDTGGANVLTPATVKALGLETQGSFEARGSGEGTEELELTHVGEVGLGKLRLRDQLFFVLPLANLESVEGVELAGLVGFEVFQRLVVTIDYAGRRLTLTRPEAFQYRGQGVAVPFTFKDRTPQVQGKLDGIPGTFSIDTGSRASLSVHAPFAAEHRLREKYGATLEALTGWGVGGGVRGLLARAGLLELGTVGVPAPLLDLPQVQKGAFADPYLAGNVGGGVLKRFTVVFDYGRKQMILEPNDSFDKPEPYDRAGIWVNLSRDAGGRADRFTVEDVVAGGPAAAAGLAVGDAITAVNGRPAAGLSLADLRIMFRTRPVGSDIELTVERGGASRNVVLTLRDLI